jgi:hypothetical protein
MKKLIYSLYILMLLIFSKITPYAVLAQDQGLPGTSYYVTYERCGADGPIVVKCRFSGGDPCSAGDQEPCP